MSRPCVWLCASSISVCYNFCFRPGKLNCNEVMSEMFLHFTQTTELYLAPNKHLRLFPSVRNNPPFFSGAKKEYKISRVQISLFSDKFCQKKIYKSLKIIFTVVFFKHLLLRACKFIAYVRERRVESTLLPDTPIRSNAKAYLKYAHHHVVGLVQGMHLNTHKQTLQLCSHYFVLCVNTSIVIPLQK